ncbi:MAG: glutamate synthase subunit beta [Candidatus Promineifilaceae bacterium]|nr:glutamate synthase subunit beta [Candidatus Promineifilaceae bacterium]
MGETTGFMRYQRQSAAERPPAQRVDDWDPFRLLLSDVSLQRQAARCMDCGIPFCHTGIELNGMTSGCPVNNLIPEWNDLVYRGLWREAYERLKRTNNFPEFTGLVCPAPCEAACTLGISDPPVAIKSLEAAIVERAFAEGWVTVEQPARWTGKRVAVVGSGPAGLACADQLNKVGHQVTVYERADRVGGLLMYGIPEMKLPKRLVRRRVDLLTEGGIRFVTGVEVGRDYPTAALRADYDAIVLCSGATRPRNLDVPGRDLEGIHFAVDFLQANTKSLLDSNHADGRYISARDKDVVVIGGGDTGTDCVATALRHGCRSLVQFEILPAPPPERTADNPWPQWPQVYRLDYGQAEAAAVHGADPRRFCVMTEAFIGAGGKLRAVQTAEVEWVASGNGRPTLRQLPGTTRQWPAQLVLLAMGFLGPESALLRQLAIECDRRSNVRTEAGDYTTNVPGVFAAGDARRGQSLVVWAIREGRGAAHACDRYLMGESALS